MRDQLREALAGAQEALEALQQQHDAVEEELGAPSLEDDRPVKRARLEGKDEEHPSSSDPNSPLTARCRLPAELDFAALAIKHPSLTPYLVHDPRGKNRATVDFKDANGSRELTRVLLKEYFGVNWSLPPGQLVPPVPNRTNYIRWIAQLLRLARPPGDVVRGLDLGCGANLIYPLLGAAMFGWAFVAADATPIALESARRNVENNPHLAGLIEVREVRPPPGVSGGTLEGGSERSAAGMETKDGAAPDSTAPHNQGGVLRPALRDSDPVFAFTMCNPPFFSTLDKAGLNPNTDHEGTAEEMVCPGGEEAFVRRMIYDSAALKDRVYWFSTMCGKKSTLKAARYQLQQCGAEVIRTTELMQGKTSRWCIAWSFQVHREMGMGELPEVLEEAGLVHGGAAARAAGASASARDAATGCAPLANNVSVASSLLGSGGVNLKGVVPRASASVMVRERNGRADTVFQGFVERMKVFGCEPVAAEGAAKTAPSSGAFSFAGNFACSGMSEELGFLPTEFSVNLSQQDKATFIFEFKLAGGQRGDSRHQRRLGWLTASLSAVVGGTR